MGKGAVLGSGGPRDPSWPDSPPLPGPGPYGEQMTSKCSFRRWCQVPASCSCVFHLLVSGEDHPTKWSGQCRGRMSARSQRSEGHLSQGASQELRLGRSASLVLGVGPGGIKGVTGVNGSEAGTTPGTCVVVAWMGAGGGEGWDGGKDGKPWEPRGGACVSLGTGVSWKRGL